MKVKKTIQEIIDAPLTKKEQKEFDSGWGENWYRGMLSKEELRLYEGSIRLDRLPHDWGTCETSGMQEEYCHCLQCYPDKSLGLEEIEGHYYQRCLFCTKPFSVRNGEIEIYCESCNNIRGDISERFSNERMARMFAERGGNYERWHKFFHEEFDTLTPEERVTRMMEFGKMDEKEEKNKGENNV